MGRTATRVVVGLAVGIGLAAPAAAPASDHADPVSLDRQEGGITDLFVFPAKGPERRTTVPGDTDRPAARQAVAGKDADRLVLILCVRRSLSAPPPYPGLGQFTYRIHADLHSDVEFRRDDPNLARYGGTVKSPEGIDPDFTIEFTLTAEATLGTTTVRSKQGGEWKDRDPAEIDRRWWYAGVRDDPFIFPQFFGTNVVAMVVSVPLKVFGGRQDFLFWATSERRGVQIDHVGRSQRTQLPRFDLLNTLPPKEHVAALRERAQNPGLVDDLLRTRIFTEFNLRPYDFQPDVMFFTRRPEFEARFPNGRQLEDDVADLTCKQGDCQLFELSQSTPLFQGPRGRSADNDRAETGTRPTKNDKEFSDVFPYLADPHPPSDPRKPPELTTRSQWLLAALGLVAAVFILLPWVLYFRAVRRLRMTALRSAPARPGSAPVGPGVGGAP